jgi:hypothetical protein
MSDSYSHGSIGQYFYNLYNKAITSLAIWAGAGTVDLAANTRFCIAAAHSPVVGFISAGVQVGDTVEIIASPVTKSATVVEVISETELYTTALSAGGAYTNADEIRVKHDGTIIYTGAVTATNPATIFCHDADAAFIDQGVCIADVVTMTVGNETAAVVSVHDTFLKTVALSGAGTYANAEAFTVANDVAKVIRVVVPRKASCAGFIRRVNLVSDLATATLSILLNTSNTPIYQQRIGTTIQSVEPCIAPQADYTPILVEMTYTTITNLGVTVLYELR